jgi:tetratricopeptide (TPR) repeat protein
MQTYLEQGLLGLLGLLGLVAATLAASWRALARTPAELTARPVALSASGAALGLILSGLTEVAALTTIGTVLLFGTVALLAVSARAGADGSASARSPTQPELSSRQWVALGGGSVVVVLVAVALTTLGPGVSALPRRVAAQLYLNLGAVEVSKAAAASKAASEEQHLARAEAFLRQAETYQPENPAIYRNLAAAALVATRPRQALPFIQQAEALASPGDDHLFFQLGRLYREAGDVERAIEAWSRVGLLATHYTIPEAPFGAWSGAGADAQLITWGTRLVEEQRWRGAIAVNEAAIQLTPISRAPYRALATALAEYREPEVALKAMQELAARYPDVPWSYEESARITRELGRLEAAQRWEARAAEARALLRHTGTVQPRCR